MITMLLGGLWHGAGWGFVLWGALHGSYQVVNHVFRRHTLAVRERLDRSTAWVFFSWALTFVAVVIAWVPFRATSLTGTRTMWSAMFSLPSVGPGISTGSLAWMVVAAGIAFFAPNAIQIFAGHYGLDPTPPMRAPLDLRWQPTRRWAVLVAGIAAISFLSLNRASEFLYFQF
jgi:hypothetical protein